MIAVRDYSLAGEEGRRAVDRGLADGRWYLPPVEARRLRELTVRTNGRAARDTVLWLALLAGFGIAAWFALGTWWAIPAFAVYGALYGGAADSRWHEMGHGTAFRSRRLNDTVYLLASFMMLREPTLWRWSHVRHHTDTIIVGRDPEILFPRPTGRLIFVLTFLGLRQYPPAIVRMVRHAFGRLDDEAKDYVPEEEWPKVIREARISVAILAGVVAWSVAAWTIVPLLYVGLPTFYGAWLAAFFAVTQHAALREDVLDHRLNTWTVRMNPVLRFLYSNMNFHVEHHLFPTVPYHALPALHEEVNEHLAPPVPSTWAAYRQILPALRRQRTDPTYEVDLAAVPATPPDEPLRRVDVGERSWAPVRADGRTDLGQADTIAVGEAHRFDAGGSTFAVYRLGRDEYAVTDGLCTHGQAHLAAGSILDCQQIECPKHNGRFDIRTGTAMRRPARDPLRTYPVEVVGGRIVADLRRPNVVAEIERQR